MRSDMLYDRYRTMAYSIALRITADAALAEDVVQDAFLGAWRNAGRYAESRASVKTWLLAIVHHRAVDAVRRRRPTIDLPEREDVPPPQLTLPDLWPEVSGRLTRKLSGAHCASLSDVQREAIELAYFGGLTQQEIAARTNTPLGTVKSRMRLGLLAMRRVLLGDAGRSPGPSPMSGGRTMTCDEVRDLAPAYVLGALEADEERLVAEHLRGCPDDHSEVADLGSVVPYLGESVPLVEPPAALRARRILAAAADDLMIRTSVVRPVTDAAAPSLPTAGAVAPRDGAALGDMQRALSSRWMRLAGDARPICAPGWSASRPCWRSSSLGAEPHHPAAAGRRPRLLPTNNKRALAGASAPRPRGAVLKSEVASETNQPVSLYCRLRAHAAPVFLRPNPPTPGSPLSGPCALRRPAAAGPLSRRPPAGPGARRAPPGAPPGPNGTGPPPAPAGPARPHPPGQPAPGGGAGGRIAT